MNYVTYTKFALYYNASEKTMFQDKNLGQLKADLFTIGNQLKVKERKVLCNDKEFDYFK